MQYSLPAPRSCVQVLVGWLARHHDFVITFRHASECASHRSQLSENGHGTWLGFLASMSRKPAGWCCSPCSCVVVGLGACQTAVSSGSVLLAAQIMQVTMHAYSVHKPTKANSPLSTSAQTAE